ncbi:hypothetical protein OH76DRAFT_1221050 [Lentinus brumalis]|uniref:Uncharacterized protein n=1 Tax=Lentinus brumalis TaxID=2498619 RepID=A0A371DLM8_9APHY|nr:hypothetical protein OH76DRAFT_1221050 [Polyporus brumalis]
MRLVTRTSRTLQSLVLSDASRTLPGAPQCDTIASCKPAPCPTVMDSCGIDDICPRDCPRPRPRSKAATDARDPCGCAPSTPLDLTLPSHCLRAASRTPLSSFPARPVVSPPAAPGPWRALRGRTISARTLGPFRGTAHGSHLELRRADLRITASQPHEVGTVYNVLDPSADGGALNTVHVRVIDHQSLVA